MEDDRGYRKRMAFTVTGVVIAIPLLLVFLLLVLDFFFNPFRSY
jgi:hypothetical protein